MTQIFTLITGATAGIGKELAICCAERNFNLLLVGLPGSGCAEFAEELRDTYGIIVDFFEVDLLQPGSTELLLKWCLDKQYRVDKLINNVGMGGRRRFEDLTGPEIEKMILLNTAVPATITNLLIPILKKEHPAYILNVSSTAAYFSIPEKSLYSATKAFVNTFSHSLRNELSGTGISVSVLCPGGSHHKVDPVVKAKTNAFYSRLLHETPQLIARKGIKGMLERKKIIFPGIVTKMYVLGDSIVPSAIVDYLVNRIFLKSHKLQDTKKRRLLAGVYITAAASLLLLLLFAFLPKHYIDDAGKPLKKSAYYKANVISQKHSISALAILGASETVYVTTDGKVYLYNLKNQQIEKEISLSQNGSFQGISFYEGVFYLLRNDGFIIALKDLGGGQYTMAEYNIPNIPPDSADHFQGLYLDTLNKRLLINISPDATKTGSNGVLGFDLINNVFIKPGLSDTNQF